MGASASHTENLNNSIENIELDWKKKVKNFVAVCIPPTYDLTYDSTDSEITELEEDNWKLLDRVPRSYSDELNSYVYHKHRESSAYRRSTEEVSESDVEGREKLEEVEIQSQFYEKSLEKLEESEDSEIEELFDEVNEVMPVYQRYSREEPEKDPHIAIKEGPCQNMKDCCRPCCPNKSAPKQLSNTCRCAHIPSSRHISDSYVSCRNLQATQHNTAHKIHNIPAHSKSAPIAVQIPKPVHSLHEKQSFHQTSSNHESDSNRHFHPAPLPRRSSNTAKGPSQVAPPARTLKPQPPIRAYQTNSFEGRVDPERPHIPLPPPPQHINDHLDNHRQSREHFHSQSIILPHHQHQQRDSTEQELERKTPQNNEEEMYSHNTNRNFSTKKQYNNNRSQYRQSMKQYPYEEPGGSTTYSHDSNCSNNCSGYEHCPMHHICKCQCLCATEEHNNYCPHQQQSDDQLSYGSDSSNSEYMNLAYQRTGDYPELMDELENTLSHRNRMRVQKTMQRFEMLSRQNKNLEKPIFEDEESVRHYNNHHKRNHETSECKCPHCEEKMRRQNTYNTRTEELVKRTNFQPTPFPRKSGYVEKVARYMDPNLNDNINTNQRESFNANQRKPKSNEHNGHEMATTVTNSNGTWQMDVRKNEWVKVDTNNNTNAQYDFENSYPPLPPRPASGQMYDRRNYGNERSSGMCSCTKCTRRPR